MKFILLSLFLVNIYLASSANWAVIVAGSNEFYNYRHQADVCHAYHILIGNGYNPDNVIVMSYNDVAKSKSNPFPNKLFNKPTQKGETPVDVNKGCVIDYEGDDVTPAVFLAILKGDTAAVKGKGNGKVLNSTKDDRVFLNFADHGAVGLIAFPNEYLYAKDLIKAFDYMHENQRYSQLVFYLEACESGSMFVDLANNTKILALSAASPDESSWATYCSPDDLVGGKHVGSCLGDLFSVNWMEDTDKGQLSETLGQQYQIIKKLTNQSQVMIWGDQSFIEEPISNYLTGGKTNQSNFNKLAKKLLGRVPAPRTGPSGSIDTRDAKLHFLMNQYMRSPNELTTVSVQQEMKQRNEFISNFTSIASRLSINDVKASVERVNDYDCLKSAIEAYESACQKFSDYGLQFVRVIALGCNKDANAIIPAIKDVCSGISL